jgi:hypothetical protein
MQTKPKQYITSTNGMPLCPTCVYYKGTYEGCMLKNLSSACHVTSCDEYVDRYKLFKKCWEGE